MSNRNGNLNVSVQVSEQEREFIEKKMKLAGIRSLRAYLLKMAVDGYVVQHDLFQVQEMVSLLRTATNKLNQIVRMTGAGITIFYTGMALGTDQGPRRLCYAESWIFRLSS